MDGTGPPPWIYPLVIALLIIPPAIAFAVGGAWAGLAVGAIALGVLLFLAARSVPRDPIPPHSPRAGEPALVLTVAPIETPETAERVSALIRDVPGTDEVLALSPMAPNAAERWLSLSGNVRSEAQAKLDRAVERLRDAGWTTRGEVVDADPARAIADQAGVHGASSIVFVVPEGWGRAERIDAVRDRTDRPVGVVEVAQA